MHAFTEHFTGMWVLLPICDIVSRVYWHLVYSLEVNDVSTQVAGASESFMQLNGQWWVYLSTHAVSYRCEQQHFMVQPEFLLTKHNTVMESI